MRANEKSLFLNYEIAQYDEISQIFSEKSAGKETLKQKRGLNAHSAFKFKAIALKVATRNADSKNKVFLLAVASA